MNRKQIIITASVAILAIVGCVLLYNCCFAPTKLLVVNSMPGREADLQYNSKDTHVELTVAAPENLTSFSGYDAILMYGRSLYLTDEQLSLLDQEIKRGVKVYTYSLRSSEFDIKANLSQADIDILDMYAGNPCGANYRNLLLYIRHLSTPHRYPHIDYAPPCVLPKNMYYHIESGKYFSDADSLTLYLQNKKLYNPNGAKIAFISGTTFPVEGSRPYIDSLISALTDAGHNVYPLTASGAKRASMLRRLSPDAVVYLPMGRIGNDSLVNWLNEQDIPLFTPFPLSAPHEEWLDVNKPIGGGVLSSRILIPEIDGGIYPLCIATQNPQTNGILLTQPENERIRSFVSTVTQHLVLRRKPNSEKHVAIGFFRSPGKDALLASNLEVVPSLYKLLKTLRAEGYDVTGLPASQQEFAGELDKYCSVLGDYAHGAQHRFMDTSYPCWISKQDYEQWVHEELLPQKYSEVVKRYGLAPGAQMARGDSLALSMLVYGNVLLFPQPRPALGDDEFKLVHGMEVPPPHNYIATYLYIRKVFDADLLLHFGTHGNLEFTPGKNAGLSQADWAEVLVGPLPHFYLYTTSNVGEAVIAKRRTHAVMITHLTAPFVESGMRRRYQNLLDAIHQALDSRGSNGFNAKSVAAKKLIVQFGLHRTLGLDSVLTVPYTYDELTEVDAFAEEIANEKVTGANYILGTPYNDSHMKTTIQAICADRIAYNAAKHDFERGIINDSQLHDNNFINHKYLPNAKKIVVAILEGGAAAPEDKELVLPCRTLLNSSSFNEMNAILRAFDGGSVHPAPGGDPVQNEAVLPTGRNMYSINVESTPTEKSWSDGVALADVTIENYRKAHDGKYPRKINYIFWAGEFITTQGATVAQALYMLGVEPVRDSHGRIVDLKLIPEQQLGRPRIDVVIQVSGQLRDIAASRLKLITDAVKLASEAPDGTLPNYVADGCREQSRELVSQGVAPARARELEHMRVFGPINSGYGSGMLPYTENSGKWDNSEELAQGYINNMSAMYGDDSNWGQVEQQLLPVALKSTDVIIQPRQSNTWGPLSLDHVYEYTGAVSLAVKTLYGYEPDAYMADYRNARIPRMQDMRLGVAVEAKATLLNPDFVKERMQGDATTASAFGEMFRNLFGWSVMRQSVLDEKIYDELYDMFVDDIHELGINNYFDRVNPAAYQEMLSTMLESARKGYWKPTRERLEKIAGMQYEFTAKHGAPCTEFLCGNRKLQEYVAQNLPDAQAGNFRARIDAAVKSRQQSPVVLTEQERNRALYHPSNLPLWAVLVVLLLLIGIGYRLMSGKKR